MIFLILVSERLNGSDEARTNGLRGGTACHLLGVLSLHLGDKRLRV